MGRFVNRFALPGFHGATDLHIPVKTGTANGTKAGTANERNVRSADRKLNQARRTRVNAERRTAYANPLKCGKIDWNM